jgi:hypothetical protein
MPTTSVATPNAAGPSPEIFAVIAAAVTATLGSKTRVASVRLAPESPSSIDIYMVQWSLEGRRQIYASHKIR